MQILKRENGIILVNQYNKKYIRFMAGGIQDKIYQISITDEEVSLIVNDKVTCDLVINKYINLNTDLPEGLIECTIKDYLDYTTDYSEKEKIDFIKMIQQYGDIFNEFYYYILSETFEDGIEECGLYASKLVKEYLLAPHEAYEFLVHLRKEPDYTLNKLKNINR